MRSFFIAAMLTIVSAPAMAVDAFDLPWTNHPVRNTVYNTSAHPSGVFVLEFGANFCSACNENAPNIAALATAYQDEGRVQVLDMMLDQNDTEISKWNLRHKPNHPVLKDVGRQVWNPLGERFIPTLVITDCRGQIQYKHTGVLTSVEKVEVKTIIDGLLTETCGTAE